jgi:hypothetical protein
MYGFGAGVGILRLAVYVFILVIILAALIKWGFDSLGWAVSGRKKFKADEDKFRKNFSKQKVTYPVADSGNQVIEADTFIDDLIAGGKYRDARTHIREMKLVAGEMGNFDAVRNYEAYERKITEEEIHNRASAQ